MSFASKSMIGPHLADHFVSFLPFVHHSISNVRRPARVRCWYSQCLEDQIVSAPKTTYHVHFHLRILVYRLSQSATHPTSAPHLPPLRASAVPRGSPQVGDPTVVALRPSTPRLRCPRSAPRDPGTWSAAADPRGDATRPGPKRPSEAPRSEEAQREAEPAVFPGGSVSGVVLGFAKVEETPSGNEVDGQKHGRIYCT